MTKEELATAIEQTKAILGADVYTESDAEMFVRMFICQEAECLLKTLERWLREVAP
jgi:hypothetical protein